MDDNHKSGPRENLAAPEVGQPPPFAFEAAQKKRLRHWRRLAFALVFGAAAALTCWSLADPLIAAAAGGAWLKALGLAALCLAALTPLLARRLSLWWRAGLGLACFYVMAWLQLRWAGPIGPGEVWLLAAPLAAAMFMGPWATAASLCLNAAVLAGVSGQCGFWSSPQTMAADQYGFFAGMLFFLDAIMAVVLAALLATHRRVIADQRIAVSDLLHSREALQATQAQLRQSEMRFRMLAENAVDIIWSMDLDLNYTYISPSVLGVTGFSAAEAMAQPLSHQTTPEAYAQLMDIFRQALRRGKQDGDWRLISQLDMPLRHKDGSHVWVSVSAAFVVGEDGRPLGLHGMSRDITKRKRATLELERKTQELAAAYDELHNTRQLIQNSRNKLKAIFDGLPDPIISLTAEGQIESLNLAAARMTKQHPRQLVGLSGQAFLSQADLPPKIIDTTLQAFQAMLQSQGRQWRLVEAPGDDDGPRFFELTVTPVADDRGETVLGIVHFDDVTEFKRMELRIRKYNDELERMVDERTQELTRARDDLQHERDRLARANSELRRLDQLRHDLTNMVVHDMKGPLAELMGNLDLLHYDLDKAQRDETLDMAEMGGQDLLRMIMNLLDIGRLEEDRLRARVQPLAFGPLAQRVRDKFTTLIRLKGLDVRVEDGATAPILADPDLMARVLQNLLTNALQHTDAGQIVLSARTQDDGQAVISVSDTGGGIPRAAHGLIFKKFVQATEDGGPRTSTGLGLTFCKLAVEAHGGEIWFESEQGQGTTFFVRLPASQPDEGEAESV